MLNVHSAVTLEYNYYVDLIISWKNRKEIVISMQKVRRMMFKASWLDLCLFQLHNLTILYLATTANVIITSWSHFEAYIIPFMFEKVKMLSKLQLVGMRGI